jgi:type IV secretory pathway VirB10-like protein
MAANPYVEARRQWDERYADLVLGKRNWQIAAGGLVAATLASPYTVMAGSVIPRGLDQRHQLGSAGTDSRPGKPESIRQRDWQVHPHSPGKPPHRRLSERVDVRQRRLQIAWQRLIFPNTSGMNLPQMPGTDQNSYAGFVDQVNKHYLATFGTAALMRLISAGARWSGR